METPAPPAWRGESPVDGGRLSERTACIAAAPPHHFVTREPPGYRTPPDGSPPLPACRPRGPAGHSPLLTKGRQRAGSDRHQHRCVIVCASPFARHLLPAATVSACRSGWNGAVVLSNWRPSREGRLKSRREATSSSLGSRLGRDDNERKRRRPSPRA